MELSPGTVVGQHARLVRPLGAGGMGTVWVAHHLRLDIPVAVKMISSEALREDPTVVERLEREATAAARIKSPHVVQILDHGVMGDGSPYVVMELLEGESLRDLLDRAGRLHPTHAAAIISQAAKALRAAHKLGIIHRDIKPDNIFLVQSDDQDVFVKVLDFGIAIRTGLGPSDRRLTATGHMVGTPAYMSPEQVTSAQPPGPAADAWSLAATAYEMLVGDIPFQGETLGSLIVSVTRGAFRPPSEAFAALGSEADAWFTRAFQLNPQARYSDVSELGSTFAQLCERLAPPVPRPLAAVHPTASFGSRMGAGPPSERPTVPKGLSSPQAPMGHAPTVQSATPHGGAQATFAGSTASLVSPRPSRGPLAAALAIVVLLVGVMVGVGIWLADDSATASKLPDVPTATASTSAGATSSVATSSAATLEAPAGMVAIPAGSYRIGCAEDELRCFSDEGPVHPVDVAAFSIMTTEVTKADYQDCMAAGDCPATARRAGCVFAKPGSNDRPVNCVTWTAAVSYCRHRGWRLPTEVEWEAAARGPEARRFPWGAEPPSCERTSMHDGRREGCGSGLPQPVGSHPADRSAAGVLDLGGNVREWTASDYLPYPGGKTLPSRRGKVNRGGSYRERVDELGTTYTRGVDPTEEAHPELGFRCAANLP